MQQGDWCVHCDTCVCAVTTVHIARQRRDRWHMLLADHCEALTDEVIRREIDEADR